jgi:FKBP-type peptidyl-prolyl cis-trans isomerase SlyD
MKEKRMSRSTYNTTLLTALAVFLLLLTAPGWTAAQQGGAVITKDKQVSLEYTLTLEDKTQVDSNIGETPLVYTQGAQQIIPGLEKQLIGLKVGDSKRIEVSPEEGYGPVHPERLVDVDKTKVPADAHKVGSMLEGRSPDGERVLARVAEVKDKIVVLDFNHPLAGKKLFFDVKVLKIEENSDQKVEVPASR